MSAPALREASLAAQLKQGLLHSKTRQHCPAGSSHPTGLPPDGGTGDDWWYSLSPSYKDTTKARWSESRLRRHALTNDRPVSQHFMEQLRALIRYEERWGDMNVPARFWEDWALGIWVADVRAAGRQQWLTPTQMRLLEESQFPFKVSGAASKWNHCFHELRRFWEEYGAEGPGFRWRDPNADFSNDLATWHHKLPEHFARRMLLPDQVLKLRSIGWRMADQTADSLSIETYRAQREEVKQSGPDVTFETLHAQLCKFQETYSTTLVPSQMHDDVSLGEWVHLLRRQKRRQALPDWQLERLDKLQFVWDVDQQTAWWHHHLHQARRYKEVHGHARIPEDYSDKKEPEWVEASRWITRNARLYAKGKLSEKHYHLIKTVLECWETNCVAEWRDAAQCFWKRDYFRIKFK